MPGAQVADRGVSLRHQFGSRKPFNPNYSSIQSRVESMINDFGSKLRHFLFTLDMRRVRLVAALEGRNVGGGDLIRRWMAAVERQRFPPHRIQVVAERRLEETLIEGLCTHLVEAGRWCCGERTEVKNPLSIFWTAKLSNRKTDAGREREEIGLCPRPK
jgi:hypothetical protein